LSIKLFLASACDKTLSLLPDLIGESRRSKRVLFVANAADNEKGVKWWVEQDRAAFEQLGCELCELIDLDLRKISKEKLRAELETGDVLHLCGGSVLYLISLLKKRELLDIIIKAVHDESVTYTGTSAGSMIAAQDLSLCRYDPEEKEYVNDPEDLSGLGLVNFLTLPHANAEFFIEINKKMIEKLPEHDQALVVLYDYQVVWVNDGSSKILTV